MIKTIRRVTIFAAAATALAITAAPSSRAQALQATQAAPLTSTPPAPPALLDVQWNPGAADCAHDTQPAIQVHRYDAQTYILRQNLCLSAEGNFLFLLLGNDQALLIDSGAITDAAKMPVAKTVLDLLPARGAGKLPLLVVHTHGHTDHTDGDAQFAGIAGVEVVPPGLDGVKKYFNFTNWPDGLAHIDLGGRIVDVLPSPGHQRAHLVFYDRNTTLLITGDFLLQGRLLIQDAAADKASAERVITFVQDKPVAYILGTHIEKNVDGEIYTPGATFHPREHVLQLSKADLLALPAAIDHYNGFYTQYGQFLMMNQNRMLAAMAAVLLLAIVLVIWGLGRFFKSRRRKKLAAASI
jgi:glyoxylase-like metal-dependent hydrolase (beta-lactamase superfamily II)